MRKNNTNGQTIIAASTILVIILLIIILSLPTIRMDIYPSSNPANLQTALEDNFYELFSRISLAYCALVASGVAFPGSDAANKANDILFDEISKIFERAENELIRRNNKFVDIIVDEVKFEVSSGNKLGADVDKSTVLVEQDIEKYYNKLKRGTGDSSFVQKLEVKLKIRELDPLAIKPYEYTITISKSIEVYKVEKKTEEGTIKIFDILTEKRPPMGLIPLTSEMSETSYRKFNLLYSIFLVSDKSRDITHRGVVLLSNRPWFSTTLMYETVTGTDVKMPFLFLAFTEYKDVDNTAILLSMANIKIKLGDWKKTYVYLRDKAASSNRIYDLLSDSDLNTVFKNTEMQFEEKLANMVLGVRDSEGRTLGEPSPYEEYLADFYHKLLSKWEDEGASGVPKIFERKGPPMLMFLLPLRSEAGGAYIWSGCMFLEDARQEWS